MIIAGLTGSIAMGKSETARLFAAHGIPVFDSDAEVHRIYGKGGAAVPVIERAFPTAVAGGMVDRAELSRIVTAAPKALAKLESLVHPLVEKARAEFIDDSRKNNEKLIILDIPLLFEMGLDRNVDRVIVLTAPPEVQRQRAPGEGPIRGFGDAHPTGDIAIEETALAFVERGGIVGEASLSICL